MINRLLAAILLALVSSTALAQSKFLESSEKGRQAMDGIVRSVAAGKLVSALNELRPLSVIDPAEFDVFEAQVKSQQSTLLKQFGPASASEFIREEKLGSRLVRLQYLVFHQKAAMRWNFILYKTDKGWVLSHFAFDANAMDFFAAAS